MLLGRATIVSHRLRWAFATIVIALAGVMTLVGAQPAAARSTAAVALGDSEISGEGAGNYEAGTNGLSNYCHRSLNAWIRKVSLGVSTKINLACSGASSANLTIGGPGQYNEASQADQLKSVARNYAVRYVFVTVGANDDPRFGPTVENCVYAYVFQTGRGCAEIDGPDWSTRVANMEPKVENAIENIKTVMAEAHYRPSRYQLIVVSYGGPAPAPPLRYQDYWSKVFNGCPLYDSDAAWGHDTAAPVLDQGERAIAEAEGVRFLDMVHGLYGHEICAFGISHSQEWVRGLEYDPTISNWWNLHSVQQSFHPNALGHAQIATCVNGFVAQTFREGTCEIGADGNLHSQPHP
jgi:lysophospholipase L1-like esterase